MRDKTKTGKFLNAHACMSGAQKMEIFHEILEHKNIFSIEKGGELQHIIIKSQF